MRLPQASTAAFVGSVLAALLALAPRSSLAESRTKAKRDAAAATVPAAPLRLWVEASAGELDAQRLRASLARELGRSVILAPSADPAELRVRLLDATHAEVTYTTPGGEKLSRKVELPADRERSLLVLSWLSLNLVRDEAAELLDELRARRRQEAEQAEERARAEAAADKAAAAEQAKQKAAADKAAAEQAKQKAAADKAAAKKRKARRPPPNDGLLREPLRSFDLALATPISLVPDSRRRELHLQLALGWGDSGGVRGIAISAGALRIRQDLAGVAVGAGFALVGGSARGVLLSAGYSQLDGDLVGVQLGAGAAVQRGATLRGALISAGGAFAGDARGLLLGAGIGYARSLQGIALSGGINLLRQPSSGLLLAGGINGTGDLRGAQVAGGVNVARDLNGVAIAPINVQRRVRGLQLGVVNVAEQVDGAALGVISLARNGRLQPVLWGSSDSSVHVAIKSIAGYAFSQIGGGIRLNGAELSYDGGVGAHFALSERYFLEPGVHYSGHHDTNDASGAPERHDLHYLLQGGMRFANKLDLLAAAGVRYTLQGGDGGARLAPEVRGGIAFF